MVNRLRNVDALQFSPRFTKHLPMPMVFFTRFTASGYFFTSSGAGTGDYLWNFKMNSIFHPFANVTTGVTWGNLSPSTYNPAGFTALLGANIYTQFIVQDALFEMDITPQSVLDSVKVAVTASTTASVPATVGAALDQPFTKSMTFASGRTYRLADYPLKMRIKTSEILGEIPLFYDNDISGNFVGGPTSDPPASLPIVVNVETGDNAVLTNPLEFSVRVTYWVKLFGLNTGALSEHFSREEQRRIRHQVKALDSEAREESELLRDVVNLTVEEKSEEKSEGAGDPDDFVRLIIGPSGHLGREKSPLTCSPEQLGLEESQNFTRARCASELWKDRLLKRVEARKSLPPARSFGRTACVSLKD
jgi:hypothetical protein